MGRSVGWNDNQPLSGRNEWKPDIRTQADERYAVAMDHPFAGIMVLALAACTAGGSVVFPSQRTIAHLETGQRFLDNLALAGAAHDTHTMNAEARVDVRDIRCGVTGSSSAMCSYETDRCTTAESDPDGDGWCARTSKFVRVDSRRGIGDVIDSGWGFDRK